MLDPHSRRVNPSLPERESVEGALVSAHVRLPRLAGAPLRVGFWCRVKGDECLKIIILNDEQ